MTNFENIKNMTIDEFTDYLNEFAIWDGAPWTKWFNENYCQKCSPVISKDLSGIKHNFAPCELDENACEFACCDPRKIIKLWLEAAKE